LKKEDIAEKYCSTGCLELLV